MTIERIESIFGIPVRKEIVSAGHIEDITTASKKGVTRQMIDEGKAPIPQEVRVRNDDKLTRLDGGYFITGTDWRPEMSATFEKEEINEAMVRSPQTWWGKRISYRWKPSK